ncbi:hypothetical protein POM88_029087 [Heracleum sosnowskyi]|uniref:Uncharacterized protein n=1 Tax=Heracleum sosnowskyi TaxID=360622 RepID=A0AAD8HSZ8_9APIA|nr:hypothetical protein POM88_029087 [Heracleum sosnowskyi]
MRHRHLSFSQIPPSDRPVRTMDFSSKVQTPLSFKRKRVDNSDIEEQRIANYDAAWRVLEGYLTELSTMLDSHIPFLIFLRKSLDIMTDVLVLKSGKSLNAIKENEIKQKSANRNIAGNGGQEEQKRHDKYVYRQSGRSSYNVATNYEALKTEIDNFLERVTTFIKEAHNRLRTSFALTSQEEKKMGAVTMTSSFLGTGSSVIVAAASVKQPMMSIRRSNVVMAKVSEVTKENVAVNNKSARREKF